VPLLVGLDGEKKMSKSLGNYVGIDEPAADQFGKLMKIGDELMPAYARYAAFRSQSECDTFAKSLEAGLLNPMDEKKRLAREIVARYHGAEAALKACEHFEATVQRREVPTGELPELSRGDAARVVDVLVKAGFAESKRAAERLISGGGVKVDGIVVSDPKAAWSAVAPAVLSVGARKFVRVLP
jgi:tyrosyl-tRNA synthetase